MPSEIGKMTQLLSMYILLAISFGLLFCVIWLIITFWYVYLGIILVGAILVGIDYLVRKFKKYATRS